MISDKTQVLQLRSKKMGILLLDARRTSKKSVDECAKALNIPTEQYLGYESGLKTPSLPEIEILAFLHNLPITHFFGKNIISQTKTKPEVTLKKELLTLRHKMITIQIKMARSQAKLSISDVSEKTSIPETDLQSYESGTPIPMAELSTLAELYGKNINDLIDQKGPIGIWNQEKVTFEKYRELPESLQQFISKPINIPYLELAQKLSKMPAEDLRSIAENILQITL